MPEAPAWVAIAAAAAAWTAASISFLSMRTARRSLRLAEAHEARCKPNLSVYRFAVTARWRLVVLMSVCPTTRALRAGPPPPPANAASAISESSTLAPIHKPSTVRPGDNASSNRSTRGDAAQFAGLLKRHVRLHASTECIDGLHLRNTRAFPARTLGTCLSFARPPDQGRR